MPIELNGVKLSFVLDTGVSRPILFNLANLDSLQIKNTEQSFLRGLGNKGTITAIRSRGNLIKVGEAIAVNRDISMVFDPTINFTSRLGVPVHGIIGYDIFKDFIVEMNYQSKYIRLHKQHSFKKPKSSSWQEVGIEIIKRKPYINGVVYDNSNTIPVKLLIDTGGSDALWLFEGSKQDIKIPEDKYFKDFLGKGLSGPVYGKRSKVNAFSLGDFRLNDVNVAYPDSLYLSIATKIKERNGSVSGNILRRFNLFFDYQSGRLWFKKNSSFKLPFYYNNSGITVEQNGYRVVKEKQTSSRLDSYGRNISDNSKGIDLTDIYRLVLRPSFQVVELRENSNAKHAGVQLGDIILSINGNETSAMSLQEVNSYFYDRKGKMIRLKIERDKEVIVMRFALDDVFQKKEPIVNSIDSN
ncbi:aspartyl protease family protein [Winogradskyella sp.]|uniref:retropepsin-like aspartic protease n=1 Tax=Winogradskyella sp. TaxID=1883156 RepID=UPI0025E00812|nr:aspartyl protease family protein [Winogradskyella sp.]